MFSYALDGKLHISLTLPNNNFVSSYYSGIIDSSKANFSYSNPKNAYICSFGNNILYSLSSQNAQTISAKNRSLNHKISIFSDNAIYLGFTKGNCQTIENKYSKIKQDALLNDLSASFAYFDDDDKLSVVSGSIYENINLTGDLDIGDGIYELMIKNNGIDIFGKPIIEISRNN